MLQFISFAGNKLKYHAQTGSWQPGRVIKWFAAKNRQYT